MPMTSSQYSRLIEPAARESGTAGQEAARGDKRYHSLINSIDEGFCVLDVIFSAEQKAIDYRFLETNPAFTLHTGLVDAVGKTVREMVPNHDDHWFEVYGKVALTGQPVRYENYAVGLKRWYSVYAFRCDGPANRNVAVIFNDITARKLVEAHTAFLTGLSERLAGVSTEADVCRVALEAVGTHLRVDRCYFVEYDAAAHRLIVGKNWLRGDSIDLTGRYIPSEFGEDDWWAKYSGGDLSVSDVTTDPLTVKYARRYLDLGIHSYAMQSFRRVGRPMVSLGVTDTVPRQWTAAELRLMDDAMARVWPLVERARSERVLRETLELRVAERTAKLQETLSELETFSYSISHDLRAPLRAMQGFAGVLESDYGESLDETARGYLHRIIRAGERMDRLIQDVLVFSRIARVETPLERVDLTPFLAGILESYPQFAEDRARIDVAAPLGYVLANPAALTQCISNLVGNAIKFVSEGTKPHVRIWSEATGNGRVRIWVADNGIGISPDHKEGIFGIFFQIDRSRGGTGIGLAVVRKAAERMGGTVGVDSVPGEGSTFWLELNAVPAP